MRITVHDTLSQTRSLLAAPLASRPALLLDLLAPVLPMYAYAPGGPIESHHFGNGFRVDVDKSARYAEALDRLEAADAWGQVERCLAEALDRLEAADAWGQVERCLTDAASYQLAATPGIATAPELHVVVLLGDLADEFFVKTTGGYFGIGGFPGYLMVTVWPTEHNIDKVGYCAVHELHHNIRFANVAWNPATVTVGDQVVSEGLAEAFVRERYGPAAMGPWGDPARGDEAAYQRVVDNLGLVGMHNLTPYVHGDATAIRMGATPVGLPTGIGYVAGLRLVDAHLAATGLTVAESTCLSTADILHPSMTT